MAATPEDVQTKLDLAIQEFLKISKIPSKMANAYGNNPTQWPAGRAHNMAVLIAEARQEAGLLTARKLTADFSIS